MQFSTCLMCDIHDVIETVAKTGLLGILWHSAVYFFLEVVFAHRSNVCSCFHPVGQYSLPQHWILGNVWGTRAAQDCSEP